MRCFFLPSCNECDEHFSRTDEELFTLKTQRTVTHSFIFNSVLPVITHLTLLKDLQLWGPQEVQPRPALSHNHNGWGWGAVLVSTHSSLANASSFPRPVHGWLTLTEGAHCACRTPALLKVDTSMTKALVWWGQSDNSKYDIPQLLSCSHKNKKPIHSSVMGTQL